MWEKTKLKSTFWWHITGIYTLHKQNQVQNLMPQTTPFISKLCQLWINEHYKMNSSVTYDSNPKSKSESNSWDIIQVPRLDELHKGKKLFEQRSKSRWFRATLTLDSRCSLWMLLTTPHRLHLKPRASGIIKLLYFRYVHLAFTTSEF